MSYSENTFNDRSRIKRWLQRRRLVSAVNLAGRYSTSPEVICDFGAGNGELCKSLAAHFPNAAVVCYEPASAYLAEARRNLQFIPGIEFANDIRCIAPQSTDLVFCLEVLEHLPMEETEQALRQIADLLRPQGFAVIGVPIEVGIPAIYKGVFRMLRRYGSFDATFGNVLRSVAFNPPSSRPLSEVSPGLRFHHEHMGFDFRRLEEMIRVDFSITEAVGSPYSIFGAALMPEIYFVVRRNDSSIASRAA